MTYERKVWLSMKTMRGENMHANYLRIPQSSARIRAGVLMLQDAARAGVGGKVTVVGEPSLPIGALRHKDGKLALVAATRMPSRPENAHP